VLERERVVSGIEDLGVGEDPLADLLAEGARGMQVDLAP